MIHLIRRYLFPRPELLLVPAMRAPSQHPAAIARRVESERNKSAAKRRAERDRQFALEVAAMMRGEGVA